MTDLDTDNLLSFCLELADESDRISMDFFNQNNITTEQKNDGSLVTVADKTIEEYLRNRIAEKMPLASVLGEEAGFVQNESDVRWIIDPIDGTHGFIRGLPVWATLIAIEREGIITDGVISAPALGTRWWASKGAGAYRSDLTSHGHDITRISVSNIKDITNAQVLYGSYSLILNKWPNVDILLRSAWRTRGFGDFWGHCLVAEGAAEAMLEGEISPWDIAAVSIILEESGGLLTDDMGNAVITAGHCISTNGFIHQAILDSIDEK
ncbi:MAG: histidinol-phosphatase [Dehalococcoidia bacterium]|nr:histidinol-phosphatase [Dehalococcoidia bacterium]